MKTSKPVLCLLALSALFLSSCRTASPVATPPTPEPLHLTLVGTNDWHGWVKPHDGKLPSGSELKEGGASLFARYVQILRGENPGGVLLLDGGDLFQGTLVSNLTEGSVVIDAFNQLGFTAAAVGNHEFDYGPAGPISVASDPGLDPFGALKARIAQARFPILSVNLTDASGARPSWLNNDGTTLVEAKGVKIGILGLTTPSTPYTTNPVNVATLRFGNLAKETVTAAAALRKRGAELVIVVAHAGGKCASHQDPHDLSTCDQAHSEIFELLGSIPPGTVDAVIAGHTHAPLGHFIAGVPVVENWGQGKAFGLIDLYVDPTTHKVLREQTKITADISICPQMDEQTQSCDAMVLARRREVKLVPASFHGQLITPDPEMEALLAPAVAKVDAEQHRPLGIAVPERLGRDYEAESPLGSMLADSIREMEKADVALLNSGGLRADLPAGPLTFGEVYEVVPFDNTLATLSLSGEDLERLIFQAYDARKGVFQESGLKLKLALCPGRGRVKQVTLANDRPLEKMRRYKVVMPDFLARGGDGLGAVVSTLNESQVDMGTKRPLNFRDQLLAFWQGHRRTLEAPTPGRITFQDDGRSCKPAKDGSAQP